MKPIIAIARITIISLLLPTLLSARDESFVGTASDKGGRILYTENYTVTYEGDAVQRTLIEYLDLAHLPLARLEGTPSSYPFLPNYTFSNFQNGSKEGVRVEDGRVIAFVQPSQENERTLVFPTAGSPLISGPGIHFFVQAQLPHLTPAKRSLLRIIMPGRQRSYQAQLQQSKRSDDRYSYPELQPTEFFARLMVGSIDMVYETATGRITEYYGVSNIKKDLLVGKTVRITYVYP